jgi:hypothetical protein
MLCVYSPDDGPLPTEKYHGDDQQGFGWSGHSLIVLRYWPLPGRTEENYEIVGVPAENGTEHIRMGGNSIAVTLNCSLSSRFERVLRIL